MCEFIIVLCLSLNPGKVTHKTCILTQLFLFVMRILHSINCPKMIIGQVGNIMVASLFLQRPLRNKLQATERFINHSSWFLFRSYMLQNGRARYCPTFRFVSFCGNYAIDWSQDTIPPPHTLTPDFKLVVFLCLE